MKIGILFDLDGTLLDSLDDLTDATNHILAQNGFPLRTRQEIRAFVGNGARTLLAKAAPEGDADALLAQYQPYYAAHCQIKSGPYPGVPEALETLKKRYPVAVVSNKPDGAVKTLCRDLFPGIPAMGEVPDCPRKPAPDMVCRAMEQLGVETCVYVGDSEVDVLTAKNAGVPCVSVLWGFRDRQQLEAAGGTVFCEKAEDLPDILEGLCRGQ